MFMCPLHSYTFYIPYTWREDIQRRKGLGGGERDKDGLRKYSHVVEATTVGEGA